MRARHQYEEAIPQYETVLARNPNMAYPLHALGECKLMTVSIEEVMPLEKRAIRLNPLDGQIAGRYWRIGLVHLLQSRTDEAIPWLEKARAANPSFGNSGRSPARAQSLGRQRNGHRGMPTRQLEPTPANELTLSLPS